MPRLRIGIDGEPLIGRLTGIGYFCLGLIEGLAGLGSSDLDIGAYAVTWSRREELERRLPPGARLVGRRMPARPMRQAWTAGRTWPLDWWTGPLDVVHGTNFVVPPARGGAVVTVHDLTSLHFPEFSDAPTRIYPEFVRRAIRRGAVVHTHSEFVAAEVVTAFGADPERVRAIAPGIPPLPAGGPVPKAVRFPRYVLAIGTVEPRKDYPALVRAFDAVAADRPELGLVIAGGEGWGAEPFRAAVDRATHRDRIVQLGYLPDPELGATLAGASVLAYPSRYEGFGFPPLQAMRAGIPVVATAAGSVPEVVGRAAVTVAVGDDDALAEALAGVLDDEALAASLSAGGARRAEAFTWASCARRMSEVYRMAYRLNSRQPS